MNKEIQDYNDLQSGEEKEICELLMKEIGLNLSEAEGKIWHGNPVWFLDNNPIVGYSKLKDCIQLLFWSGQSFEEKKLKPIGKNKAAEARYTRIGQVDLQDLKHWLIQSRKIQWDYKNIVKHKGELKRLK